MQKSKCCNPNNRGLSVGLVIFRINNLPVNNPDEFRLAMDGQIDSMTKDNKSAITLYVRDRNNLYQYVALRFEIPEE